MGKNIVICSDGTGNSGGRFDGTNVWRIHQAVLAAETSDGCDRNFDDVENYDAAEHDDREPSREQVVIYQDGVGTETLRPLAALGLMFSFGITKDLETLYERLVLQYDVGDKLFLFGFSRGAFTIRTLAYILYRCGLPSREDETGKRRTPQQIKDIAAEAIAAYKLRHIGKDTEFRLKYGIAVDKIRPDEQKTVGKLTPEEVRHRNVKFQGRVDIQFIGVWDTVSAVGLPFHNITQGIFTFWRAVTSFRAFRWAKFSLLNFRRQTNRYWTEWEDDLHPHIKNAYQALSLDDERETFYPLLWLELEHCPCTKSPEPSQKVTTAKTRHKIFSEEQEVKAFRKKDINVEQVWFAGMHANVGGGYPKDHLAHVSLIWMMEHASNAGLIFSEHVWREYREQAKPLGKMYDSRAGLAMYYRYKPRDVEWFSKDVGLTHEWDNHEIHPLIHRSVFERIQDASQAYAPRSLPLPFNYIEVDNPPARTKEDDRSVLPASKRFPWQDQPTIADNACTEQKWTLNRSDDNQASQTRNDIRAIRKTTTQRLQPYVSLRRSTSRWIMLLTVLCFSLGAFKKTARWAKEVDAWIFGVLRDYCDNVSQIGRHLTGQQVPPVVSIWLPVLIALAVVSVRSYFKPREKPTYSLSQVLSYSALCVMVGFIIRPAIAPVVLAVVPAFIGNFLSGLLNSPTLFALLSGLMCFTLRLNAAYLREIEEWSASGWLQTQFKDVHIPKDLSWSVFGNLFPDGTPRAKLLGRIIFPGVSLFLFGAVVCGGIWLVMSDALIRMRVQTAVAVSKDSNDKKPTVVPPDAQTASISFASGSISATGLHVRAGQHYVLSLNSPGAATNVVWKDSTIKASLSGIPWNSTDKESPARDHASNIMTLLSGATRKPSDQYFQLCGAIGQPAAEAFVIHPDRTFTAPNDGELFVFVNDVPGFYFNNSGKTNMTIKLVNEPSID